MHTDKTEYSLLEVWNAGEKAREIVRPEAVHTRPVPLKRPVLDEPALAGDIVDECGFGSFPGKLPAKLVGSGGFVMVPLAAPGQRQARWSRR